MAPQKSEDWMRRAFHLAEKGRPYVSPNPMVGACLVKGGQLIAEGYHAYYGGPHAEIEALKKAGRRAQGATLYVTLEPCSSWGKTPPCIRPLIDAKIKEVIIGAVDPNPRHAGAGIGLLKKAGIRTTVGVLANEILKQNESFVKHVTTGLPFVTLKMAQSLDGKIATFEGKARWITSAAARQMVHGIRFEQDAVLVGKNTWKKDNPFLSPRQKRLFLKDKPWRVVIDPDGEIPDSARFFKGPQASFQAVTLKGAKRLRHVKTRVTRNILVVKDHRGRLDVRDLCEQLGALGVAKLLVEGGGETAWSFLEAGMADRALWMVAPILIGGRSAPSSVQGSGVRDLKKAFRFRELLVHPAGPDFIFDGRF